MIDNENLFTQAPNSKKKSKGAMPNMIIENLDKEKNSSSDSLSAYTCKIYRGNIAGNDLTELATIESILSRGLAGKGDIVIIDKATQSFEDNYWVIITYLEKRV